MVDCNEENGMDEIGATWKWLVSRSLATYCTIECMLHIIIVYISTN